MIGLYSLSIDALPADRRRVTQNVILIGTVAIFALFLAMVPAGLLVVAVGAIAVLLILLRWPWVIWLILAVAVPITSGVRFGRISLTEMLIAAAIGLWLIEGARRKTLRTYGSLVLLPILAFIAVMAFSLMRAPDLGDGFAEVVKWAEFALVIMLLPIMLSRKHVVWLVGAIVAGGVLQALIGLYQFIFQIGPEWFLLYDRFMRASGTFRQPNPYAAYLGVLLPIAVTMALWQIFRWNEPSQNRIARIAWTFYFTVAVAFIAMGILVSWSRGAWMATVAALVAALAFRSVRSFVLVSGGMVIIASLSILGLLASSFLPASLVERVSGSLSYFTIGSELSSAVNQSVNDANFATIERLAHWIAGIRMWESSPWIGIGAGNYAVVYERFRLPLWTEPLGHAHSLYLNLLAEVGLVGLVAFVVMWVWLAVWVMRSRSSASAIGVKSWCTAMSAGVIGAMVYLTVHSIVDMLFVQGIYLVLAMSVATLATGCRADADIAEEIIEG